MKDEELCSSWVNVLFPKPRSALYFILPPSSFAFSSPYFRTRCTTTSISAVCGNMSSGVTLSSS